MATPIVPVKICCLYEAASRESRTIMTKLIYDLTREGVLSEEWCKDWDAMTDVAMSPEEFAEGGR